MTYGNRIRKRIILAISITTKCLVASFVELQSLARIAQTQQVRYEPSPSYLKAYACADSDLFSKEPFLILSCSPPSLSPANVRKPQERFRDATCNQVPECLWSKRFIETKARLQATFEPATKH